MEDNIHPVVRLLAKRMESNPEEFGHKGSGRWAAWLEPLMRLATDEEKLLLRTARMNEVHEEVMDELLNGDERRAEERRQREELEKQQAQKLQAQLQQANAMLQQSAVQQAAQLYGQTQGIYLQNANTAVPSSLQIQQGSMKLGDETLDAGMLRQIKKKLGL